MCLSVGVCLVVVVVVATSKHARKASEIPGANDGHCWCISCGLPCKCKERESSIKHLTMKKCPPSSSRTGHESDCTHFAKTCFCMQISKTCSETWDQENSSSLSAKRMPMRARLPSWVSFCMNLKEIHRLKTVRAFVKGTGFSVVDKGNKLKQPLRWGSTKSWLLVCFDKFVKRLTISLFCR